MTIPSHVLPTLFLHKLSLQSIIPRDAASRYNGCSSMLIMIVIALFFFLCSSTSAIDRCVERERRALLAIKQDIYQPALADTDKLSWLSSWTATADCCTCRGVVCDNETNHVTKLDLQYPYPYLDDGKYFPGPRFELYPVAELDVDDRAGADTQEQTADPSSSH